MQRIIKKIEEPYLKNGLPVLEPGDTVRVVIKVVEGDKSRLQVFEGVVIAIQGEGMGKSFKVRKISYGVGVERTFPFYSPNIDSFEVVKKGSPRRAKLFYLRDRIGKRALKVKASKGKVEYEELLVTEDMAGGGEVAEVVEVAETGTDQENPPSPTPVAEKQEPESQKNQ